MKRPLFFYCSRHSVRNRWFGGTVVSSRSSCRKKKTKQDENDDRFVLNWVFFFLSWSSNVYCDLGRRPRWIFRLFFSTWLLRGYRTQVPGCSTRLVRTLIWACCVTNAMTPVLLRSSRPVLRHHRCLRFPPWTAKAHRSFHDRRSLILPAHLQAAESFTARCNWDSRPWETTMQAQESQKSQVPHRMSHQAKRRLWKSWKRFISPCAYQMVIILLTLLSLDKY